MSWWNNLFSKRFLSSQTTIGSLLRKGLSNTAIVREIRQLGKGWRTQQMYRDINNQRAVLNAEEWWEIGSEQSRVPESAIAKSDFPHFREYTYRLEFTTTDKEGNLTDSIFVNMSSDRNLTKEEIYNQAEKIAEEAVNRYKLNVTGTFLNAVVQRVRF